MTQDIYSRIQKLLDSYQGTSMIKRAKGEEVKEEAMEHAVVPEQAVEPGQFSKEMDRILREYLPSSVAAKDELDEEDAEISQEDIQEQSPATTEVSIADEDEESVEPESPICVGEEAEKELKNAKKAARRLSDEALIREFQIAVHDIVGALSALEKSAAFTGVVPMFVPNSPQGVLSGVIKQANTDADLVAAYIKQAQEEALAAGAPPEEAAQAAEETAKEVEQAADEAVEALDETVDEVVDDLQEVLDEVADEVDEVVTEIESELRAQGNEEAAQLVRPMAADLVAQAFGFQGAAAVAPEAVAPVAVAPGAVGAPAAPPKAEEEEEDEEETEDKEEIAEELSELKDEEAVNELGNAMEDLGVTPDELVEEAKDKEARKKAALIAQAVKHLKMAKRFKRTAAVYDKHRKIRSAMKNYLLELMS